MHSDVDLTSNRYFASEYKEKKFNHPHKVLPWERTNDEFAELNNHKLNIRQSDLKYIYESINGWNTLNMTVNYERGVPHSIYLSDISDDYNKYYEILEDTTSIKTPNTKYRNFPTGKGVSARDIKFFRETSNDKDQCSKALKARESFFDLIEYTSKTCHRCGKKLSLSEYLLNKKMIRTDATKICDCNIKTIYKTNLPSRWRYDRKRYLERKFPYLKNNNSLMFVTLERNLTRNTHILAYDRTQRIPCLSASMRQYGKRPEKMQINEMREYYDYYEDKPLNFRIRNKRGDFIESNIAYHKGKPELRMREAVWQPKGRVPQEYDKLFDNINWQDMLKLRLGEINSLSGTKKKKNNTQLNTFTITNEIIEHQVFRFNIDNDIWG